MNIADFLINYGIGFAATLAGLIAAIKLHEQFWPMQELPRTIAPAAMLGALLGFFLAR